MSNRTNRRGDHGLPLPPPAGTKTSKSFKAIDLLADDRWNKFTIPALTILLTIAVASLILLLIGRSPVTAFKSFLQGSGLWPKNIYTANKGILTDLFSFLGIFSPMLLASLGVVVAMKAGMFNIGISGQMLLSGFIATVFVGYSNLPGWAAKPLVLIIGIAAGGLLGALVGYLKYRFNIHEVVSTIMFNYIISYITGFFINGFYADTITRTSRAIKPASRLLISDLTLSGQKINFPIGLPIALITVFIILFFINRTVSGFEIKMIGYNRICAQYAGVRVGSGLVRAMAISGILAGLAGVTYYLGCYNTIVPKELASMGYDSIAVSLLGNSSPVGCIFASFLITIFQKGSVYMSSSTGVAKEIASVITGILLLFSATGIYIKTIAKRRRGDHETTAALPRPGDHETIADPRTGDRCLHAEAMPRCRVAHETIADPRPGDHETIADPRTGDHETIADPRPGDHETIADPRPGDHETIADPRRGDHGLPETPPSSEKQPKGTPKWNP